MNNNTTKLDESFEIVKDIDFKELIPNIIDNYFVTIYENHHTIFLPINHTGVHFKAWMRGKGGIFSKDVKDYSFNQPHGKYVLIKNNEIKCIARIISEGEELHFKSMKLVDGKIKDRPYMILKMLEQNESHVSTKLNFNSGNINDLEEEREYISDHRNIDNNEDYEQHKGSISLID